jgi:hypothetical protein
MAEPNWVDAVRNSHIDRAMQRLREGVNRDVETRNNQLQELGSGFSFHVRDIDDGFVVYREGGLGPSRAVKFVDRRDGGAIHVIDPDQDNKLLFRIVPRIGAEGLCCSVIEGEDTEHHDWQVRKRALERLFFPPR